MNVVFLGGKGSAVTTCALALAGGWPMGPASPVLVEADASGGDLAARFDLPATPSLLTAAATLHQPTPGMLLEHTHMLTGGVRLIAAPARAAELGGGLADFARMVMLPLRRSTEVDLLVDAGRCDTRGLPMVAMHADLVVVVVRQDAHSASSTLARCLHAQQVTEVVAARGLPPVVLLVGDAPYRPADIGAFLGLAVVGVLPEDPHGASLLAGRPASARTARRSRLAAAASDAASVLAAQLRVPTTVPTSVLSPAHSPVAVSAL